tara:strand:- start:2560 stop:4059 length:1500 start_codon:yes stop_codon:yes gene_type:complete
MEKRILVWFGVEFTHFSLIHSLQKKLNAKYYAIIDTTNSQKKFFDNQSLVKLEQKWYLHDHIKKKYEVDLEYLKDIEKKYELNLWKMTINERIFYRYFNFHKFERDEILSIEEQILKFYEKILEEIKPDYLIIKLPHLHHQELLIKICRVKKIRVLMLNTSLIGPGSILMEKTSEYDEKEKFHNTKYNMMSFDECSKILKGTKQNMTETVVKEKMFEGKLFKLFFNYILSNNKKIETNYDYYGRTKFKVITYEINQLFKRIWRKKFIDGNLEKNPDLESSFIYMPLNVDMERTTLIDAPFFSNYIETVRSVAKSIPVNSWLFVKEHPAQIMRSWRSTRDYRELLNIPNVVLIHPDFSNHDLYKNCNLVITIGGTSGFEAAVYKKPTIILTDLRYDILPSVERCKSIEKLPELIQDSLKKEVDYNDVSKYLYFTKSIISDFNWGRFNRDFNNTFYPNNNVDVEISEKQLEKFLKEQNDPLDLLADFHIKKMEYFENQKKN